MSREKEFRRRWYEAHRDRLMEDEDGYQEAVSRIEQFRSGISGATRLLDELGRTGDLAAFKQGTTSWAGRSAKKFNYTIGQMTLNILCNRATDLERVAKLLAQSLVAPETDEDALTKIGAVTEYAESIKKRGTPALKNLPFVLSYFWGLADHARWPVIWPSGRRFVEHLTGTWLPSDPSERYQAFLEGVREVSNDIREFEMTASWWDDVWPVFLDEVLMERAVFGFDQQVPIEEREINAGALLSIADNWGESLAEEVSAALECEPEELEYKTPPLEWKQGRPRGDVWVDWYNPEVPELGIRIWVTDRGAAVALRPGLVRKGWRKEVAPILESADYPGCRVLGGPFSYIGEDVGLGGRNWAEFVYGRWFKREQFDEVDLAATVVEVAELLKPLYNELLDLALGNKRQTQNQGDLLDPLVEQFVREKNYPTNEDTEHEVQRAQYVNLLKPDAVFDLVRLRHIWSKNTYFGRTGQMSRLNGSFKNANDEKRESMFDAIRYLCWGAEPHAQRIDRMLADESLRISGLGESVIMKLLAITHPKTFIPIFPYDGPKGKAAILDLLDLDRRRPPSVVATSRP